MISKDLNVGDRFTDCDREYEVQKVLGDGSYISKAVDALPGEDLTEEAENATEVLSCQYCGKEYKQKSSLEKHEASCTENPANKE